MGENEDEVMAFVQAANTLFDDDPRWVPQLFRDGSSFSDFYSVWLEATDALLRLNNLFGAEQSILSVTPFEPHSISSGAFCSLRPAFARRRLANIAVIEAEGLYIAEIVSMLQRGLLDSPVAGLGRLLELVAKHRKDPALTPNTRAALKFYINAAYGMLARSKSSRLSLTPPVGVVAHSIRDRMHRLFDMFPESIAYIDTDTIFVRRSDASPVFATARILFNTVQRWFPEEHVEAIFLRRQMYTLKYPDGSLKVHGHKNPVDTEEKFDAWSDHA
jgi:hypothetical protein